MTATAQKTMEFFGLREALAAFARAANGRLPVAHSRKELN